MLIGAVMSGSQSLEPRLRAGRLPMRPKEMVVDTYSP